MTELIPQECACGCGQMAAVDLRRKRVSKYVSGHNSRTAHPMKGKKHTAETIVKLKDLTGEKSSMFKHGWSTTPTWKSWKSMQERCYDSRNASYPHYGAKGVTVCERWRADFLNFLADMGARPGKEWAVDRIDPNGNYEPSNCRWLTRAENIARREDPGGWKARRARMAREAEASE